MFSVEGKRLFRNSRQKGTIKAVEPSTKVKKADEGGPLTIQQTNKLHNGSGGLSFRMARHEGVQENEGTQRAEDGETKGRNEHRPCVHCAERLLYVTVIGPRQPHGGTSRD